jgi:lipopolysaccharide export system protein LptA
MKITVKGNKLTIEADLAEKPTPSASGKTLVLASTRGNLKTGQTFKVEGTDREIVLGLNAYVAR